MRSRGFNKAHFSIKKAYAIALPILVATSCVLFIWYIIFWVANEIHQHFGISKILAEVAVMCFVVVVVIALYVVLLYKTIE